jgi:hypothetical protein
MHILCIIELSMSREKSACPTGAAMTEPGEFNGSRDKTNSMQK